MAENSIFLIAGLGNPGSEYAANRHNVGFMAVDELAAKYGFSAPSKKFRSIWCEGSIASSKAAIMKPQTFMNLSGESVGEACRFYKIEPGQVIVLHDEIDLELGRLRVKKGGGHGGHNGLKSIDSHIGKEYWRIRIGVGRPQGQGEVTNHVLGNFAKSEAQLLSDMLWAISSHFPLLLAGDDATFMNKVASTLFPPPLRGRAREGGDATNTTRDFARELRKNMTEAEQKLWYHLRRHNLSGHKFRRQQPLGPYIADFICFEKKLILEIDGGQHGQTIEKDAKRTDYLEKTDHKVLRFWNNEVMENIEGVLQLITRELEARPPLPDPLPQGERE